MQAWLNSYGCHTHFSKIVQILMRHPVCLHWVSVVRGPNQIFKASVTPIKIEMQNTLPQADVVAAENLHYFL